MSTTEDAQEAPTLDTELAHAAAELEAGDVDDALRHLAMALSLDPTHPDARRLLDRALDEAGERALDLLRIEEGTFFGVAALRAYVLARRGYPEEALALLFGVVRFRPEVPYLLWAPEWLAGDAARSRLRGVTPDEIAGSAVAFLETVSRKDADHPGIRRNLEGTLAAVRRLRARHPENERLTFVELLTLRRLGRDREALDLARRWFATKPSWISAVELANTHREQGNADEAVAYYRRALAFAPGDTSPLLDMGDVLLENRRFDEAGRAYAEVLARQPHDRWAEPSHAFAQYRATGQERWRRELEELAARSADGSRARELAGRL